MALVHNLYSASGLSCDDCCSLGQRYDDSQPFSVYRCESMVIAHEPGSPESPVILSAPLITNRYFTMLWRSPDKMVYVTDPQDGMLRAQQDAKKWPRQDLGVTLKGVWGLDDGTVFTWGVERKGDSALFRWDGKAWKSMPSPGAIVRMHGSSAKDLLAVGQNGLLAHWDGKGWTEIPVDTVETLSGIFMVSANEYYAVGQEGGFFEGSAYGCRKKLVWKDGSLADVAKFGGKVWVAAPFQGLLQLKGKKPALEVVKPNLKATSLEARGDLLISCPDMIVSSKDGKTFTAAAFDYVEELRKGHKPLWKD